MSKKISILFLLSLFIFCSCGEYEVLEHRKECKRIADSTYRAEMKNLGQISDSICNLNYDNYYQTSLDSLIPARMEEVKKLIRK